MKKLKNITIFTVAGEEERIERYSLAQVKMICDNPAAKGTVIRLMPDVHPGKIGPIGLTMTVGDRIIPGLIGVDIGCGITVTRIEKATSFNEICFHLLRWAVFIMR